jgi:hypothetical protein
VTDADLRRAIRVVAAVLERGEASHPADSPRHWLALSVRQHVARAAARLLLALARREREKNIGRGR